MHSPSLQQRWPLNSETTDELHDLALRHGMISLFTDGVRKAVDGVTTLEEVGRVC